MNIVDGVDLVDSETHNFLGHPKRQLSLIPLPMIMHAVGIHTIQLQMAATIDASLIFSKSPL